jgi:hypothetical protein
MFATQPVDGAFFDTAPVRLKGTFDIAQPAPDVWAELTADNPLAWCKILTEIIWTSERPFAVGTTRTARSLGGTSVINERYFRWEDGRRQSFYAVEASAPLWRRFAEDYLVEPTSETSCRFTWIIAFEPKPATRVTNPVNKRLLGTLFRDTAKHYGLG